MDSENNEQIVMKDVSVQTETLKIMKIKSISNSIKQFFGDPLSKSEISKKRARKILKEYIILDDFINKNMVIGLVIKANPFFRKPFSSKTPESELTFLLNENLFENNERFKKMIEETHEGQVTINLFKSTLQKIIQNKNDVFDKFNNLIDYNVLNGQTSLCAFVFWISNYTTGNLLHFIYQFTLLFFIVFWTRAKGKLFTSFFLKEFSMEKHANELEDLKKLYKTVFDDKLCFIINPFDLISYLHDFMLISCQST